MIHEILDLLLGPELWGSVQHASDEMLSLMRGPYCLVPKYHCYLFYRSRMYETLLKSCIDSSWTTGNFFRGNWSFSLLRRCLGWSSWHLIMWSPSTTFREKAVTGDVLYKQDLSLQIGSALTHMIWCHELHPINPTAS